MSGIPEDTLTSLVDRWKFIQTELNSGLDQETFARLSKEFSDLDPVVVAINELREARREEADLRVMIKDPGTDVDMKQMAEAELPDVETRVEGLVQDLRIQLLPKDDADDKSAILELRAGTGGDEAALFAGDLFRMYQRYADLKGWKVEVISSSESVSGGYREIIAAIKGKSVFARMKFESGVHRVQRVPATETQGRVHTSAATVAVLPEAEDVDIDIKAEDIRIDTMRAGGAGGQHVNTTDSAVRMLHIPTGIMVVASEKSQHQNRRTAMQILRARVYEAERVKVANERAEARKEQVGSGDRSQRIRTYNFPQGRITDHRINLTLHKLDQMMQGTIVDEVVDALVTDHQATLLADLERSTASS